MKKSLSLKNSLVVYFSWSGNTRKIAYQINQLLGGDIYEIEAAKEYSTVYREVVSKAREELRSGEKPELKNKLASIDQYDKIFYWLSKLVQYISSSCVLIFIGI